MKLGSPADGAIDIPDRSTGCQWIQRNTVGCIPACNILPDSCDFRPQNYSIFKTFQDQDHVNKKKRLTVLTLSYFSTLIRTIHLIHTFMTCTLSMFYLQKMQKKFKVKCASHGGMYGPHYFGKISSKE